jgi:PAS domain S-box-containing protein
LVFAPEDRVDEALLHHLPGALALVALEATSPEELDALAMPVLTPALGERLARRSLADPTVPTDLDEPEARLVREVAGVLRTARRRIETEQELRASNRQLAASERLTRLLLESAGEGLYAIDMEGRCTAANREAVRLLGYDHEDELLGEDMHRMAHHSRPDGSPYPAAECRIFQAWREGRGIVCDDEVLFRRDGTSFPVEYRSYPITLADGRVQGSVLTFFDITDRRAAELELLQLHDDRRRTALSLHDNVVQALATANYALALSEADMAGKALAQAMQTSQALVTELLADRAIDEHVLIRAEPSLPKDQAT